MFFLLMADFFIWHLFYFAAMKQNKTLIIDCCNNINLIIVLSKWVMRHKWIIHWIMYDKSSLKYYFPL